MSILKVNEQAVRWVIPRAMAVVLALSAPKLAYEAVGAMTESSVFVVEQVDVSGLEGLSRDEVLYAAGFDTPRNILTVAEEDVRARLEEHAWIRSAEVSVNFRTRSVAVNIEERHLAAVAVGAHVLLLDRNGEAIRRWAPDTPLTAPVLVGVDTTDREATRAALALIDQVNASARAAANPVREIHAVGPAGYRLWLEDGFEIRIARDRVDDRLAYLDPALQHAEGNPAYVYLTSDDITRAVVGRASNARTGVPQ